MSKEKLSFGDRLIIWQRFLTSPEGATYDRVMKLCEKEGKSRHLDPRMNHYTDYYSNVRKDVPMIRELLNGTEVSLNESGPQKNKVFTLSSDIDLISLYNQNKVLKPYQNLFTLLEKMEGFLPESVLSGLSSAYKQIKEKQYTESVVSFATDYRDIDSMQFFSEVFKAINKYPLLVERKRLQNSDKTFNVILYPEYLKQYNSEWFAFGVVTNEEGERESEDCSRIPMALITKVTPIRRTGMPFISSDTDYEEYFEDIIGVERDLHCPIETIKIRVSRKMFNRLKKYPLHDSQKECKEISTPSMRGISIEVRRNMELIRKLLNFGHDIEVVEPKKLRNKIKKELEKALKMYD